MIIEELKEKGQAPEWLTESGLATLMGGYLQEGETPRDMWKRVSATAAHKLQKPELEDKFFELFWKNWLCGATPVLSNFGTNRGLPISCLAGDTWINTRSGGTQIKDIEVGQEVLSHEGRYRKVLAKKSRFSSGDLFELKVGTRLTTTQVTGNHPVLTNLGWVRVDELDAKKHLIATNKEIEYVEKKYVIDLSNYLNYEAIEIENKLLKKSTNKIKRKNTGIVTYYAAPTKNIEVDEDFAWALGLWFAEGSRSISPKKQANGIRITLNTNEKDIAEKWSSIISNKLSINCNCFISKATRANWANGKECQWLTVNANSKLVGSFFSKEFGINGKTKKIPQWIIDLPKPILSKFLDGLIMGDGHFRNGNEKNWEMTLANPELLLAAYNICLKLGIDVNLQMQVKPSNIGKTKYVYHLRSLIKDSIKLSRNNAKAGVQFGKLCFCPIIKLNKVDYDVEVWDIEVEEDHSFSANGVIFHNCNSIHVNDSLHSIFMKQHELAILSKNGAGVGIYLGDVRGRNAKITGNGKSEGIIPWLKCYDSTTISVSQGSTRRGASAVYLPVDHTDISEFIQCRRATGDIHRRAMNLHHGVCVTDEFIEGVKGGHTEKRETWREILKTRMETGEPYLFFTDNVNRQRPQCYIDKNFFIKTSNICNEIYLYTDPDHTFVCCLSSLNLAKYDEWKDTDTIKLAIWFLDSVITEYIEKAQHIVGLEAAVRFAQKSRAVGLGALGWHTLLQSKMIPFESSEAMFLNGEIFRLIQKQAKEANQDLAKEYGEPEWCQGYGQRCSHTTALAPTASNSIISGNQSPGIEPLTANLFSHKTAKGTFFSYNPILKKILAEKGQDNMDTWKQILADEGSVHNLNFLSDHEKEVFLTARQINQKVIIQQAAQRQKWIDQGQSVNLFFNKNSHPKYINEVHLLAHEMGLKGLYYLRSQSVLKGDSISRQNTEECKACEG